MADPQTQYSYQASREAVAGVFHFVRRVLVRWWLIVGAMVLAVPAALLAPRVIRPIYQAQSTLMYRNTVTAEYVLVGRPRSETWRDKSTRYRDLVLTRANLEDMVRQFGLYPDVVASLGLVAATERLRADLSVEFPSGTMLTLEYKSTDKSKLVPVLARLEQAFKDQPVVDSVEEAKATKKFLEKQYATASEELGKKESEMAGFVAGHPEFANTDRGAGGFGTMTRAMQRDTGAPVSRETTLRRQIARLEARLAAPSSDANALSKSGTRLVPEDQQRIDAAQHVADTARARLARLQEQFTPAHPDVRAAQSDLAKAEAEVANVRSTARSAPGVSAAPVDTPQLRQQLQQQLANLRADVMRQPEGEAPESAPNRASSKTPTSSDDEYVESVVALETEWTSLLREVEDARQQHSSIGQRLFEADTVVKLVSLAGTGQIVTIDAPLEPTAPIAKSPLTTGTRVSVGLVILGVLLAAFLALLDDRVYREQDLLVPGDASFVALIPRLGAPGATKTHD